VSSLTVTRGSKKILSKLRVQNVKNYEYKERFDKIEMEKWFSNQEIKY
jgi:hypothetical protein